FFFSFSVQSTRFFFTLSLHDALPIFLGSVISPGESPCDSLDCITSCSLPDDSCIVSASNTSTWSSISCSSACSLNSSSYLFTSRSEEHTSELQSRFDLVCRLLLEKKQ